MRCMIVSCRREGWRCEQWGVFTKRPEARKASGRRYLLRGVVHEFQQSTVVSVPQQRWAMFISIPEAVRVQDCGGFDCTFVAY